MASQRAGSAALVVLLAACGASTPDDARESTTGARAPDRSAGGGAGAGARAGDAHGDRVHRRVSAREYAAMLDTPERLAWQKPEQLVEALAIRPGMRVADVGTGSGYFLPYLDRAVRPNGAVVGEDIDPELLAIAREKVQRQRLARVELRRGAAANPSLEPRSYDLVLLVDTYHHVSDRPRFLMHLSRALDPQSGRLVVVEFADGDLPIGPPAGHKLPRAQVERELADAGFVVLREHHFLPYQYVLELVARASPVMGGQSAPCGPAVGVPCEGGMARPQIVIDSDLTATEGGFPAVSGDHARIAIATADADASFVVRISGLDGRTLEEQAILTSSEGARAERGDPGARLRAAVEGRAARVRALLDRGAFRSMVPVPIRSSGARRRVDATASGFAISYDPATRALIVRDGDSTAGPELVHETLAPGPGIAGTERCASFAPHIVGMWIDREARVAVVRVAYSGQGGCRAPVPRDRILRLHPR